jgi:beta-galactosidase
MGLNPSNSVSKGLVSHFIARHVIWGRLSIVAAFALAALLSLSGCGDSEPAPTAPGGQDGGSAAQVRMTVRFMENWKFTKDDRLSVDDALASTGAAWDTVNLPHTWNAKDAASLQSRGYDRGLGWYRLEFTTPTTGVRHWIEFGAASLVADVWLNGRSLGRHRGGFNQFRFDVTDAIAAAGANVLVVRVDNRDPNNDDDPTAIDPLGGDYNKAGGLYRHVALISTSAVHFDLGDLGGPGIYASTTTVANGSATVSVRARIQNDSNERGDYTVRFSLFDAAGQTSGTAETGAQIAGGASTEVTEDLTIPSAHLWQGVEDPYQYRFVVELIDGGGTTIDRVTTPFGIREFRFDPNQGFFLNGRHVRLHGVAVHQDYLGRAWALSDRDVDKSLALVKEVGANAIRLGHYPFSQYFMEKISELGLLAWAEKASGLRTTVESCSSKQPTDEYLQNARLQLQETIRQQYNHAAVVMRSIGNETEAGQSFCGDTFDNVTAYLRGLDSLARVEDPTRPTANAEFTYSGGFAGDLPFTTAGITDVLGTNRYFLWYDLRYENFSPLLDRIHSAFPQQSVGVTEYGAGAALTHHTDNPLGGPPEVRSAPEDEVSFQPEEYQAYVHEQDWRVISSKPYLWGSFIWNMFDFGSAHRNEGDVLGVNTKGIVSFDRETRKDAFYFYKANWTREPVTYITGRRYTERAYRLNDVKVYSNADTVTLLVNDQPIATMNAAQCDQKACVFKDVVLRRGMSRIVAVGDHAGQRVEDTVTWSYNERDVNIAAGRLATGLVTSTGVRYGSDHFFTGGAGSLYRFGDDASGRVPEDIGGTEDPELYKYLRRGEFTYDIPLPDGRYEVTLGFLEPRTDLDVGGRVFTVTMNGQPVLTDFDILQEAEEARTAVTRTFPVTVSGGRLTLSFTPTTRDAVVSHISIRNVGGYPG